MATSDKISSLLSSLAEYAPKVGPYCGKHSLYNIASAQNEADKAVKVTEEASKAVCLQCVDANLLS